ncbi:MAG: phosphate acyltransferase PlsX [Candidatus Margulisbacteria bacterium]|nr:phosphate acyltransferase PlsX [Candidatus Margulisiibacteriota bacterium]
MHIALDAMGGDDAPVETVKGAVLALKDYPITITLVGREDCIRKELSKLNQKESDRLRILHASEVVEMGESPAQSFRKKKNSSLRLGLDMVKEKVADGFVSAGNTGAFMATSVLVLGKIPNIDRPAIATVLSTNNGPVLLLDIGSNVDCKPHHLEQFALMGHYFASLVLKVENPKVGLINIGEEEDKGDTLVLAAYPLLKKLPINFVGNVESRDILTGKVQVMVCDGFLGNNLLKFGEGLIDVFMGFFKNDCQQSWISKLGAMLLIPALKRFKKKFDYEETGGAPLLGVDGVCVVAHGRSQAKAIKNAIFRAYQESESNVIATIQEAVSQ